MHKLGKKLWMMIESVQGHAYLSDTIEEMPDEEVILYAQTALPFAKAVVLILEQFLKQFS